MNHKQKHIQIHTYKHTHTHKQTNKQKHVQTHTHTNTKTLSIKNSRKSPNYYMIFFIYLSTWCKFHFKTSHFRFAGIFLAKIKRSDVGGGSVLSTKHCMWLCHKFEYGCRRCTTFSLLQQHVLPGIYIIYIEGNRGIYCSISDLYCSNRDLYYSIRDHY